MNATPRVRRRLFVSVFLPMILAAACSSSGGSGDGGESESREACDNFQPLRQPLLHGLGFAGALSEIGLPPGEIPLALFSFNLGIEAGQLAFIAALSLLAHAAAKMPVPRILRRIEIPAYVIGSLAVYWIFERISGSVVL